MKPKPITYYKLYLSWSIGIHPRNARIFLHMWINKYDMSYQQREQKPCDHFKTRSKDLR